MSKLYIVGKLNKVDVSKGILEATDSWDFIGVFSTKEKAVEFINKYEDVFLFVAGTVEVDSPLSVYDNVDLEYQDYPLFKKVLKTIASKYL